jgi:hypothetical protein
MEMRDGSWAEEAAEQGGIPSKKARKASAGDKHPAEQGQNIVDCGEEMQQGLNRLRKNARIASKDARKASRRG